MRSGGLRPCVAALSLVAIAVFTSACGTDEPSAATRRSLVNPTTQIAGAGVLGNDRKPDESCARDASAPDPGPPNRSARNVAGVTPSETQVPADPQRIVVLSGDQLDALCALGLQSRVVAAALPDGSSNQPSYLGKVIHDAPGAGSRALPDLRVVTAAHPDLILGSVALTPTLYPQLAAIAPTVFTAAPGAAWADNLRGVGAATGRTAAADALINGFNQRANDFAGKHDSAHFQVSVVQLTATTLRVYGADNFPASVLAAAKVDRPGPQRFTDKPYIEFGATDADLAKGPDFGAADGDIIYVSCASQAATDRAAAFLDSGPWRKLGANRDNRVFVVDDEIWQSGQGVIAARGVLSDLRWINAPIN